MKRHPLPVIAIFLLFEASKLAGQINPGTGGRGYAMDELRNRNYDGTAELLGSLPGSGSRHIGIPGQWTALSFRGQALNRTTLLIDGIPIQDPWTGYVDLNWIPEAWIDSVWVHATADPFEASPGGTVHLRTFGENNKRPYTRFAYRTGADDFSDLDVTFIEPFGQRFKVVSGLMRNQYGKTLADRKSDQTSVRAKILYQPGKNWKIAYTGLSNRHELGLPFLALVPGDSIASHSLKRNTKRTDHALQISGSALNLAHELTVHYASINYSYGEGTADASITVDAFFPVRSFDAAITQKPIRSIVPVSWGISFIENELDALKPGRIHQTFTTAFIRGDFSVKNRLNAAARIAQCFSKYGNRLTGTLQVSCKPAPAFTVWLQASTDVRLPSLGEHTGVVQQPFPNPVWIAGSIAKENPGLRYEANRIFEAGLNWLPREAFGISFRGYGNFIRDRISPRYSYPNTVQFVNQGNESFRGGEITLAWKPFSGLRAELVLNALISKPLIREDPFFLPSQWGNAALTEEWAWFQGDLRFIAYAGLRFSGKRDFENEKGYAPGWLFVDWKITAVVMQRARFFLSMDQAAGDEVEILPYFPFPRKILRMGLVWELVD